MKIKRKIILIISFIIAFILTIISVSYANTPSPETTTNKEFVYLSDLSYMKDKSYVASDHSIHLDENDSNGLLSLKLNENSTPFMKGICAWATSEIVYDLNSYDYDYFTCYLGVDIGEQSTYFNTGVKFYIYTSDNGENWNQQFVSDALYGWSEAVWTKVDIKNANYLKLVADDNSDSWWSNLYDEAIYANAKLIKEDYVEDKSTVDFIKTVAQYDAIIKNHFNEPIRGDYELTLLQREFVNNVGYDLLQAFAKHSDEYKNTLLWLMNDAETLRLYLVGGKPEGGNYLKSLKVLASLYTTYQNDLANQTVTQYGTKLGDLYRNMMLSISLTHSGKVYLWISDKVPASDAITRYEIYKKLHQEGRIENKTFESLTVEEMRWVMNTIIDDEEIEWLNDYVRDAKNGATSPYSYITYTFGYNYNLDKYYDSANYNTWNAKYNLDKYHITYQKGQPKLWIVFEEGSVCGGLSKTGSCIWGSYKGLPNTCVSQPGHCAYIYYSQDANGNGFWSLGNDVFGWGQSGRTEHLNVRTMNDWGNGSYTTGWNASYILLAQAAQNEYKKYESAEETLMLANVYHDDAKKLEEIYRNSLKIESINFDAWLGLVNLYLNDARKTEADYYRLAEEIATTLKYYPRPMYDLLTLLEPKFQSPEYAVKFTLLKTNALTDAKNATDSDTLQVTAVKQVANVLLGLYDSNIATFSFDGEDAGAIILSGRYDGVDVQWEYSLNGGNTWTNTGEHRHVLTAQELASITSESDIKIHVIGVDYSDENIFTIDIQKATTPTNLYNNDLENKVIGATDTMEWKLNDKDSWTSFKDKDPDLTGNKTVMVRVGSTGTYLPSDTVTLRYTQDNQADTKKYIPLSHLSVHQVSSEATSNNGHAIHAIDGNINTLWHSQWNGNDTERYISIKLDSPVYLSAVEYVPRQSGTNGRIKNAELYTSMDGVNWKKSASVTNWSNDASAKTLTLAESTQAQYVKLVSTDYYGDGRSFITATMINLFEDITKKTVPTAEIQYDIKKPTNQNVTAKLVNPSTGLTITNNAGKDSYVFTKNGEFTFEFVNPQGVTGSVTAKVDWIDKVIPTATISYDITETTSQDVIAKISNFSEEVTIINNSGKDSYTFAKNGTFEFRFKDKAGNIGKAVATVNWIKEETLPSSPNTPPNNSNTNTNDGDTNTNTDTNTNVDSDISSNTNTDSNQNISDIGNPVDNKDLTIFEVVNNKEPDTSLPKKYDTTASAILPNAGKTNVLIPLGVCLVLGCIAVAILVSKKFQRKKI